MEFLKECGYDDLVKLWNTMHSARAEPNPTSLYFDGALKNIKRNTAIMATELYRKKITSAKAFLINEGGAPFAIMFAMGLTPETILKKWQNGSMNIESLLYGKSKTPKTVKKLKEKCGVKEEHKGLRLAEAMNNLIIETFPNEFSIGSKVTMQQFYNVTKKFMIFNAWDFTACDRILITSKRGGCYQTMPIVDAMLATMASGLIKQVEWNNSLYGSASGYDPYPLSKFDKLLRTMNMTNQPLGSIKGFYDSPEKKNKTSSIEDVKLERPKFARSISGQLSGKMMKLQ
jgi:hypothetical protein